MNGQLLNPGLYALQKRQKRGQAEKLIQKNIYLTNDKMRRMIAQRLAFKMTNCQIGQIRRKVRQRLGLPSRRVSKKLKGLGAIPIEQALRGM